MKVKLNSNSVAETGVIAEKLAKSTFVPSVISLVGDLGAGKTTFTKEFIRARGVGETVTSPTYTYLNEYNAPDGTKIYHFDLYRLSSLEEAHELGFAEYFDLTKLDGIVLVEWASNCAGILPLRHFEVEINKTGETGREICISPKGLV